MRLLFNSERQIMTAFRTLCAAAALALTAVLAPPAPAANSQVIKMPDGLQYTDDKIGGGAAPPLPGQR